MVSHFFHITTTYTNIEWSPTKTLEQVYLLQLPTPLHALELIWLGSETFQKAIVMHRSGSLY